MKRKKAGRPPTTGKTRGARIAYRVDVDEMTEIAAAAAPESPHEWSRKVTLAEARKAKRKRKG